MKNSSVWRPRITVSDATQKRLWENLRDLRDLSEETLGVTPRCLCIKVPLFTILARRNQVTSTILIAVSLIIMSAFLDIRHVFGINLAYFVTSLWQTCICKRNQYFMNSFWMALWLNISMSKIIDNMSKIHIDRLQLPAGF